MIGGDQVLSIASEHDCS